MANIENYEFGRITIDGKTYTNDLIIFPDKIKSDWWRDEGHLLQVQDLTEVWEEKPDKLIVGKGAKGVMDIDSEVMSKCEKLNMELVAKKSKKACEYYNDLGDKEKKKAVLAIHLTC